MTERLKQVADGCPDCRCRLSVVVCKNRHPIDKSNNALGALYAANKREGVFQPGGVLCRIGCYELLLSRVELPSGRAIRGILAKCAHFI